MNGEAGKGDKTCPFNRKRWDDGWDHAYGKKNTFFDELKEIDKILEKANRMVDDDQI